MALVGQTCPPIGGLQFVKGDAFDVPGHGGPTVIELWASWCGPCRVMFPHLSKVAAQYADRGLRIVGVSLEPDSPKLRSFVQSQGDNMAYSVAVDPRGEAQALLRRAEMSGIPAAFVADARGIIRYQGHPGDPAFASAVQQVCAEEPQAPQPKEQALPLVTASREELMAMPVRELKRLLDERRVEHSDLREKGELADRIMQRCSTTVYYTTT